MAFLGVLRFLGYAGPGGHSRSNPKFQGQNDSKSLILRRKGGW